MSDDKRPKVVISVHECKGCGLCIEICPKKNLKKSKNFNKLGYQYTEFEDQGCTSCGFCFYTCPEPGAITVHKKKKEPKGE